MLEQLLMMSEFHAAHIRDNVQHVIWTGCRSGHGHGAQQHQETLYSRYRHDTPPSKSRASGATRRQRGVRACSFDLAS